MMIDGPCSAHAPRPLRRREPLHRAEAAVKAALYDRYGDADVVRVAEVPEPSPGPGEVLVEVHAAALNPKDVLVRKGRYALLSGRRFPKRPGFDLAGIVRAVGPRVD